MLGLAAAEEPPDSALPDDVAITVNHGLYWLTAQPAEERALRFLVDDASWADPAALLFLNYLGRRVAELPTLVALGLRPADSGDRSSRYERSRTRKR